MIQSINWFDREFPFNPPAGMYPNIVERLRGTPARLEDRVSQLSPDILTRQYQDKWSIQEHVGHLLDLGSLDLSRLDDFATNREILQAADLQNRKTYEANHNAKPIGSILKELRAERLELVRRLEGFDEAFIARTALHPRLKRQMRVVDFVYFVAEHDDHHLARITELLKMLTENEGQA